MQREAILELTEAAAAALRRGALRRVAGAEHDPLRAVPDVRHLSPWRDDVRLVARDRNLCSSREEALLHALALRVRRRVEEILRVADVDEIGGGVDDGDPRLTLDRIGDRRVGVLRERFDGVLLGGAQLLDALVEDRAERRAIAHPRDETRVLVERLDGVGGDDRVLEVLEEVILRVDRLDRGEHVIRAVLREVVVVEVRRAELPDVEREEHRLLLVERQVVFPEVARLVVVVLAHLEEIRDRLERAGEEPREPLERVEDDVAGVDDGGVVDAVVEQIARALVATVDSRSAVRARRAPLVDPKEAVTEGGRWRVQVIRREDERRGAGLDLLEERCELLAVVLSEPGRIERQLVYEEREARRVATHRVLGFGIGGLGRVEERAQRRLHLRGRIGLAVRRLEPVGRVRLPAHVARSAAIPVPETEPLHVVGELRLACLRDERFDVRGPVIRGVRAERQKKEERDEDTEPQERGPARGERHRREGYYRTAAMLAAVLRERRKATCRSRASR